jgi:1,2-diacylglycerol 3-beta-glucosyltransferase
VIFLTAHADKETVESALKTAPYGYMIKPFDEDKLHSTLEIALEKKRSEKVKYEKLGAKISSKQDELKMEKTGIFFVSAIFISLAAYGFIIKDMTWLAYLLFIPACYNIFLCIISLKKQEKPIEFDNPPMVSILIPAHNEENTIERCVVSLSEMDYYLKGEKNFEIIVINDGSTDDTGKVMENLKNKVDCLRIVTRRPPRSGKGKGYVLNDGVKMARGEAIAVFDADSRVDSDFLNKIIPYLNGDNVVGVQSRVRMYNKDRNLLTAMQEAEFAIFGNVILRSRDIMGKNGFLGGNGQITTRKVMEEIEGWDGFAVTEDLNLSIKLMLKGYKIRYCGEAEVWQEAVPFWRPFFRQRVRWATGNLETLFVYLAPIIDADIPIYKKIDSIQYLFFLLFIAFVMLGYIVVILDFGLIYSIKVNIPLAIGLLSTAAFFPGAILGIYRDKGRGIFSAVFTSIKYWAYCLYLIPLFFASFVHMITRKDRTWAKTDHSGDEE